MKTFSIQLKQARLTNKMTQEETSKALGIPLNTYRNYEALGSGHRMPGHAMVLKMAELFGVTIDELFGKR